MELLTSKLICYSSRYDSQLTGQSATIRHEDNHDIDAFG